MATSLGKQPDASGFGMMGLTWRPYPVPLEQAMDTMRAAVENGATIWNAAEFYGTPEYNSMTILKEYLTKHPEDVEKVTLYVKGGAKAGQPLPDGSPENIRRSLDNMIAQLGGVKKVDAFACARRDLAVPLEITLEVIQKEYIDTGKIGGIYLSECSAQTIREACKHIKVVAAELELSMFYPEILHNGIAAACKEFDIPIIAYSPLSKGLLTGRFTDGSQLKDLGITSMAPRLQPDALGNNLQLVRQVEVLAQKKGCTPAQFALGWIRNLSNDPELPKIVPTPSATTAARVVENVKLVAFDDAEMKTLRNLIRGFRVAGGRVRPGMPHDT